MGKIAFLDPLPFPNEKKDLRILLLQPSISFSPPQFWRTAACTTTNIFRLLEESMENDLLIGCIRNSSSFFLMSIHSSPILVTFVSFLPDFGASLKIDEGGRLRLGFRTTSITGNSSLAAAAAAAAMGMKLGVESPGEGGWSAGISQFLAEIVALQSGQLELFWNQMSMQSTWKWWLQIGIFLNSSSGWNSIRQTAHSLPAVDSLVGFL